MTVTGSNIDIATYIDHSLLNPTATPQEVEQCCEEAQRYGFPTVCVYPSAVNQAAKLLHGKKITVCTVIGFPTGATTSAVKLYEAQEAAENGARELDVMINLGYVKAGQSEAIYNEISAICEATGQTIKVILEMSLLTETEKRLAAEICMDAGANYLKTSTGWFGGATVADVRYLKQVSKGQVGIKASGGIRTLEQAIALIEAGAKRLGTSRGVDLIKQQEFMEKE
ncbi:deoxyribose-phosphate aldolase [Crocosphaera sp. UHCC 0190]|uniref:deoxyribose-phosphate aldolase n=1 Tax=Crocosphaera sp. UHCC 0190 TaxID=3110246 RepID=UPI002B209B34|nr:deoxyribose-phosphate aldolase [Crocosphaera sp. UHCC 0190]MEA5508141.1 deoxyribose-phosphate aldolase [Crocosphaera sp. UHCC 0190]